jgi:hypothetical protein
MSRKCWSKSVGGYGSTIRVAERKRGGILYLFWIDNMGKQRKRSLRHRDRKRAIKQAQEYASMLAVDESVEVRSKPLTLVEGIARAFDPLEGMYPAQTRYTVEARRLADRAAGILGEQLLWEEFTPGKLQSLVRVLARSSEDGEGARTAEYMCDVLYIVAGWLRDEGFIPPTAALPKRRWKARMKEEWQAITGQRVEPRRPRHTEEEAAKIFKALQDADPRLRLLIELAAELRAGQAVRAKRSDLSLEPVGGFGLGRFTVRGRGKKKGEIVDLHPELRRHVEQVLTEGYLTDAEVALRDGRIDDYYLFPTGRLKEGRAQLKHCRDKPLGPTAIRGMFRKLEEVAGVEHQSGRSFYGLRRLATDLAPEFEQDDRVLDRLTGHADSETRKQVYQDRQSDQIRARAATARRRMRHRLRGEGKEVQSQS